MKKKDISNIPKSIPVQQLAETNNGKLDPYAALFDNLKTSSYEIIPPFVQQRISFTNKNTLCLCIVRGFIELSVNGHSERLEANDYAYIMHNSKIRMISYSDDFTFFLFSLFDELLRTVHRDLGWNYKPANMNYVFKRKHLSDEDASYRLGLYLEYKQEINRNESPTKHWIVRGLTNVLLIKDREFFDQEIIDKTATQNAASRQRIMFNRFFDLLNLHFEREREVQFYASLLNITPKYLSALCVQYSGKNASTWIDEYVMTKAKQMLREHKYTVKEVAEILNFKSQSFFGRFFKRNEGMSPKVFMLMN